jgi:hypothetical protein
MPPQDARVMAAFHQPSDAVLWALQVQAAVHHLFR